MTPRIPSAGKSFNSVPSSMVSTTEIFTLPEVITLCAVSSALKKAELPMAEMEKMIEIREMRSSFRFFIYTAPLMEMEWP